MITGKVYLMLVTLCSDARSVTIGVVTLLLRNKEFQIAASCTKDLIFIYLKKSKRCEEDLLCHNVSDGSHHIKDCLRWSVSSSLHLQTGFSA